MPPYKLQVLQALTVVDSTHEINEPRIVCFPTCRILWKQEKKMYVCGFTKCVGRLEMTLHVFNSSQYMYIIHAKLQCIMLLCVQGMHVLALDTVNFILHPVV